MEGSGDLEEGGGLMELLGPGDLLYLDGDEAATHEMLCFAGGASQKSSDSSLSTICSSSPRSSSATSSKASKKVEVGGGGKGGRRNTTAAAGGSAASKKIKTEASGRPGTIKVRKAKLGERILSLQQLVSPFGKTDTASVLHEALSYIQFLHDQVQVLSTPYLQRLPSSTRLNVADGGRRGEEPTLSNLRSRGLCLVPVSCTERVAHSSSNGADFWASATGSNSSSTATTTTMQ